MSSEHQIEFTRKTIDEYLREVAKAYRKQIGKRMPAEMVLVGGAAILINYGFREMTTDIDALIQAASCMKDAINDVGDRFGLSNGWLNVDFMNTDSYTPKLMEYSQYYKTYANVLTIRTVSAEYLIAMKLRSGRRYKNDLSDVLGILTSHKEDGAPITMDRIKKAVSDLYGNWTALPEASQRFIQQVMEGERYEKLYEETRKNELAAKEFLLEFEENAPGVAAASNVDAILDTMQHQDAASVLELLRKKQKEEGVIQQQEAEKP